MESDLKASISCSADQIRQDIQPRPKPKDANRRFLSINSLSILSYTQTHKLSLIHLIESMVKRCEIRTKPKKNHTSNNINKNKIVEKCLKFIT